MTGARGVLALDPYLDCQRRPLFQTRPKEGSQPALVLELWSKLAPTLSGGSFFNFCFSSITSKWLYVSGQLCRAPLPFFCSSLTFFKKLFIGRAYRVGPRAVLLLWRHPGWRGAWKRPLVTWRVRCADASSSSAGGAAPVIT